ncbi:T9SS type A sorting domain-containing protein [Hymenobacter monticola]|uniref:T9SS type A sorting domain-containing protein n=1 Tax=Hymenobacter monticola TaxID=1705399 RepID=A0ABY4B8S2_9BACT|nr:T9SS type A sorting domain-containing protein [Hymenobacter monticola]UOE35572.1 T9SS type A sorting domain-containing protein [Hymenobacter monticola]
MTYISSLLRRGFFTGLLLMLWLAGPAARAQSLQMTAAMVPTPNSSLQQGPMTTDAAGNVFVAGYFFGTVSFGAITLTSQGYFDMFIAKWSPAARAFVWAKQVRGTTYVQPDRLVSSGGSLYVAGRFYYTATFDNTSLTAAGTNGANADVFVAKLLDGGGTASWAWAVRAGGSGNDIATGLAVNGPNVYATGSFAGTAAFGATALTSAGDTDGFVAKLLDAGTAASFGWVLSIGSTGSDFSNALAVSGTALYLAGGFSGAVGFGSTVLTSTNFDMFVAKLTDAGSAASFNWALAVGGASSLVNPSDLAVGGGNVYVTGRFQGQCTFGTAQLSSTLDPYFPSNDIFVTKVTDGNGSAAFAWARRAGGIGDDAALGLIARGSNLYITGYFGGVADFGTTTVTSTGDADVYVAKLTDTGPGGSFGWVQQAGGSRADIAYSIAAAGSTVYAHGFVNTPATFSGTPLPGSIPTNTRLGFLASLADPTLTATMAAKDNLGFSIAPNPARSTATVQLPAVPGATSAVLTLTDAMGRSVRTETLSWASAGRPHTLDLRGLPPGLYAVQVQAGSTRGTQRLVVE